MIKTGPNFGPFVISGKTILKSIFRYQLDLLFVSCHQDGCRDHVGQTSRNKSFDRKVSVWIGIVNRMPIQGATVFVVNFPNINFCRRQPLQSIGHIYRPYAPRRPIAQFHDRTIVVLRDPHRCLPTLEAASPAMLDRERTSIPPDLVLFRG